MPFLQTPNQTPPALFRGRCRNVHAHQINKLKRRLQGWPDAMPNVTNRIMNPINGGKKKKKKKLGDEKIHVHGLDDLLPVPTLFRFRVHHLPYLLHHFKGGLDVAQIGVGLERFKPLLDPLALPRHKGRAAQEEEWHQHDAVGPRVLRQLVQVGQAIVDDLGDLFARPRRPDGAVQVHPCRLAVQLC